MRLIKMINSYFSFIALLVLLCGCGRKVERGVNASVITETQLRGEVIKSGDHLLEGYILSATQEDLIIAETKEDLMLRRYHVANDSLTLKEAVFSRGMGPLEMPALPPPYYDPHQERLYVYDANMRKELAVDIGTDSMRIYSSSLIGIDSLIINSYAPLSATSVVVAYVAPRADAASSAIIGKVDHDLNIFTPVVGAGRPETHQYTFDEAVYYAGQSNLLSQPGGDKVLYWLGIGEYAEIFEIDNQQAVNKKILLNEYPYFEIGDNMRPRGVKDEVKTGLYGVFVTPNRIYLSLPRATIGDARAEKKGSLNPKFEGPAKSRSYADQIYVYDWDGNPVGNLKLDRGITLFAVDQDDSVIFAMSEDDDYNPIIIRCPLK